MSRGVIHRLTEIIARDGGEWVCHYCGVGLVPNGTPYGAEPYYLYELVKVAHPATCGDCNGRYTCEEVMHYVNAYIRGDLIYWQAHYSLAPGYRRPAVDHVVPRAKGGKNHLSNLVACCYECNQAKKDKDYDVFIRSLVGGGS